MKDRNKIQQIVFIGGSGRSGTTLLQAMLNAHKDIYGGPEFGYLGKVCGLRNLIESSTNPDNKLDVYFSKSELNKKFRDFILNLLEQPCINNSKIIISEKSPNNVFAFSELVKIFPNAKYLFVIRDPRAIYSSFKDINSKAKLNKSAKIRVPGYSKNLYRGLSYLNDSWSCGFDFVKKHPANSLVVSYEDLVLDPLITTKNICDFIGIEWDSQMLDHVGQMGKIINENEVSIWGGTKMYHQQIHHKSIDKWKKNLSSAEVGIINKKIFKDPLIEQKYYTEKHSTSHSLNFIWQLSLYNWKDFVFRLRKKAKSFIKKHL